MKYLVNIQNPTDTPWLDWIDIGLKKYEGRLNREKWAMMRVGDLIEFVDPNNKRVLTCITDLKYYRDFEQAYDDLGSLLVPKETVTSMEVGELYSQYFTETDIKKYGVIAIGVDKVI